MSEVSEHHLSPSAPPLLLPLDQRITLGQDRAGFWGDRPLVPPDIPTSEVLHPASPPKI